MADHLKFYINGEWVAPLSLETIEVINPSDESVIGSISAGTKEDIDLAVAAAKEAFKTFGFSSKEERINLLENIISEYEKRSEELAKTISEEMGAPLWLSTVAQVTSGLSHFKDTLEVLKTYEFEGTENNYLVRKEPIGVIGMITPWNWPMNQMCTKVASAIASGCTMVLKPSEITPFCGIIFAEILDAAKVPAGVFNLVNGMGPIVGAALSEHQDIDMMHFTGSTRAGVAVAIASAPTVKRVAQELGELGLVHLAEVRQAGHLPHDAAVVVRRDSRQPLEHLLGALVVAAHLVARAATARRVRCLRVHVGLPFFELLEKVHREARVRGPDDPQVREGHGQQRHLRADVVQVHAVAEVRLALQGEGALGRELHQQRGRLVVAAHGLGLVE